MTITATGREFLERMFSDLKRRAQTLREPTEHKPAGFALPVADYVWRKSS